MIVYSAGEMFFVVSLNKKFPHLCNIIRATYTLVGWGVALSIRGVFSPPRLLPGDVTFPVLAQFCRHLVRCALPLAIALFVAIAIYELRNFCKFTLDNF